MDSTQLYVVVPVALASIALVGYVISKKSSLPRPPGPKGIPILGNIFDFPKEKEWLTYAKWGDEYGECSTKIEYEVLDSFQEESCLCRLWARPSLS